VTVTLAVVNHNSSQALRRFLDGAASGADQVIVVDSGSTEPGVEEAVESSGATLVRLANVGYGAALNRAAALAEGDVLVASNPDIVSRPEAVRALAAAVGEPGVALAAPRLHFPDGSLQRSAHRHEPGLLLTVYEQWYPLHAVDWRLHMRFHPTAYSARAHQQPLRPRHVMGALFAVRLDAFNAVGGFDETFFLYREETDLCRRLRAAGWDITYHPDIEATHEGGGSTTETHLTQARPVYLTSHYHYIAKHRGRTMAIVARAVGAASAGMWFLTGPKRGLARTSLRWHLGR
jgi:GT2 family glycosyltransferase